MIQKFKPDLEVFSKILTKFRFLLLDRNRNYDVIKHHKSLKLDSKAAEYSHWPILDSILKADFQPKTILYWPSGKKI